MQDYVFYKDEQISSPTVHVMEMALEPRLSMKASLLYLEYVLNGLLDSHRAWIERRQLEAMRQGYFETAESAKACGWRQLLVSVPAAKIILGSRVLSLPHAVTSPIQGLTKSQSSGQPSGPKFSCYVPILSDSAAPSTSPQSPSNSSKKLSKVLNRGFGFLSSGNNKSPREINLSTPPINHSKPNRKIDDSIPSTYVEIYVENRLETVTVKFILRF
jgi:hypothetical protein